MTPEQLDAIQARADAATEGPWEHQPYGGQNQNGDYAGGHIIGADGEYVISEVPDNDGAFIAHARTDVPALLAYARDLEARVGRVRAEAWDEGMNYSFTLLNADEFVPSFRKENPYLAALTATEASK